MDKKTITGLLDKNYTSFVKYIKSLSPEEYLFSYQQKWTAGQQLEHIVLCVKPLVQVFSMDKSLIEQTFGKSSRANQAYEKILSDYREKLQQGGKAPTRFVPEASAIEQREFLCETLAKLIKELCSKIENFTDQELDTLCIPHPLLGHLTLREMLFNAIYHIEHHQEQAKQNLKKK